jgi:uncharacterized protein YbaR (Trm112 family)
MMARLDPLLLEVLACPVCIAPVTPMPSADDAQSLHCQVCGRSYPVRDGIPVMLVDEADQSQSSVDPE